MNREIKFRVWDKDLKRIRYLNTEHDFIRFDALGRVYYENMQTGLGEWFSDLMQYTGLKDKNGKEIYEGDIIKSLINTFKIVFKKGCFFAVGINREQEYTLFEEFEMCNKANVNLEVIGNVYDKGE